MDTRAPKQTLRNLAPSEIRPNPENPRLVFRQDEMESLMLSINRHGIQVPITVYAESDHYVLIDGERRWRCAVKLNLRSVPALVQKKPSELENLVLMYNIHSLREQWDYFTIASKLERVIELYATEHGHDPSEITLSELTGLTRAAIRRCQLLIDLPERFKTLIMEELEKPKSQQQLTEDFFIEMERSLKTIVTRIPEYKPEIESIRDTLIQKFKEKTISAITDFRQLSKIATAVEGLGVAQKQAKAALDKVFDPENKASIREVYADAVQFEYVERKAGRFAESLSSFIEDIERENRLAELDADILTSFRHLHTILTRLLGY